MQKIKSKLIGILTTVMLPTLALADIPSIPSSTDALSFIPKSTDVSMAFLARIFGHVGFSLAGADQTIIGQMYSMFNAGILIIASIFVTYVTIKITLDASASGQVFNQKMHPGIIIRVASGIGALIPSFNGYSMLQIMVMWFITQGVGFADKGWEMAINYLNKGGLIYVASDKINNDNLIDKKLVDTNPTYVSGADPTYGAATDVLRSMVCINTINRSIQSQAQALQQDVINHPANYTEANKQIINNLSTSQTALKPYFNETSKIAYYPGIDPKNPPQLLPGMDPNQFNGACGTYSWSINVDNMVQSANTFFKQHQWQFGLSQEDLAVINKNATDYENAKEEGLKQMTVNVTPAAVQMVDQAYDNQTNYTSSTNLQADYAIVQAAANYQTVIYSSRLLANNGFLTIEQLGIDDNEGIWSTWYSGATKQGWAMAGSYAFLVADITKNYGSLDQDNYQLTIATIYPPSTQDNNPDSSRVSSLSNVQHLINSTPDNTNLVTALNWVNAARNTALDDTQKLNDAIEARNYTNKNMPDDLTQSIFFNSSQENMFKFKAQLSENTTMDQAISKFLKDVGLTKQPQPKQIINMALASIETSLNNVVDTWYNNMTKVQSGGPLVNVMNMGKGMTKNAASIWRNMIALSKQITIPYFEKQDDLYNSFNGFGVTNISQTFMLKTSVQSAMITGVYQLYLSFLFWIVPLAVAIATPLFVSGVMLSVYTPLIPFMLFTFGVMSWFISVIEAMTAAPLVALGLTHPEGHDLLGKSEQAVMLLVSVFVRPIAMVIGLVLGIILSYIALSILNVGIATIVESIFGTGPSQATLGFLIILIHTFITVSLINQCFALIYTLPDKIMAWLGVHGQGSDIQHLMDGVKQGVTPFVQGAADGMGHVTSSSQNAMNSAASAVNKGVESEVQMKKQYGQTARGGIETIGKAFI